MNTTVKRYIISIIRLFLSTFLTSLALQIQMIWDIDQKVLTSLFLWALLTSVTTVAKYIQEKKLIKKFINMIVK